MSSLLDVRLGVQEPAILHRPPDVVSLDAAEEAIELADAYGICDGHPLSDSQKITLRAGLGERADGSWAAARVADFGPRQGTGKSDKIAARELAGLILFGERLIIHTAHEFPTANESFLRLVAVFDAWDDLSAKVLRVRYGNGEQAIEMKSGARLKYRARTSGSGRGFAKADLVVYDEAQHLSREHVAASGPAKLANPNSQTWYAGSGGFSSSAVAWELRRAALLGTGRRLAYTEATAERPSVVDGELSFERPDPSDVEAWYRAMPGLGRWVTLESVQDMYDELGPALFAREGLCVWDPPVLADGGEGLDVRAWQDALSPHAAHGSVVLGVSADPNLTHAAIAVGFTRPDGRRHVALSDWRPTIAWLPDRVRELRRSLPVSAVLVDRPLHGQVEGEQVGPGKVAAAHNRLATAIADGTLAHDGDGPLDVAVTAVRWRPWGDTRVLVRVGATDVAPVLAAALTVPEPSPAGLLTSPVSFGADAGHLVVPQIADPYRPLS